MCWYCKGMRDCLRRDQSAQRSTSYKQPGNGNFSEYEDGDLLMSISEGASGIMVQSGVTTDGEEDLLCCERGVVGVVPGVGCGGLSIDILGVGRLMSWG